MITRHDERLIASMRGVASAGAPLLAHQDATTHVDRMPKVHYDVGPKGTPEHTDGQVDNPAGHTDRTDHLDQAVAYGEENAPILLPGSAGPERPGVSASELHALLARLERVLAAREEQLHRAVTLRLDALASEFRSALLDFKAETEDRLSTLEAGRAPGP